MHDFLTVRETEVLMDLAGQVHAHQIPLPPEIVSLNEQIEKRMRHAALFRAKLCVDDTQALREIVQMKLKKDALYAQWARSEARDLV